MKRKSYYISVGEYARVINECLLALALGLTQKQVRDGMKSTKIKKLK